MADGQNSRRAIWVSSDSERKTCTYERNGLCLCIWFKLAYCESTLLHEKYSQHFYCLERDLIEHLIKVSYFIGEKTEIQQDYILSKVTYWIRR